MVWRDCPCPCESEANILPGVGQDASDKQEYGLLCEYAIADCHPKTAGGVKQNCSIHRRGIVERKVMKSTHTGQLEIPGLNPIPCAVLEDGTRVLSERGVNKAIGRPRGGRDWERSGGGGAQLPVFVAGSRLKPF